MPKGFGTQIIAGVLGLLFVVGLVLLGRRIGQDLKNRYLAQNQSKETITPTPLPFQEVIGINPTLNQKKGEIISSITSQNENATVSSKGNIQEIPQTGSEIFLFPAIFIPLAFYLRKKSNLK